MVRLAHISDVHISATQLGWSPRDYFTSASPPGSRSASQAGRALCTVRSIDVSRGLQPSWVAEICTSLICASRTMGRFLRGGGCVPSVIPGARFQRAILVRHAGSVPHGAAVLYNGRSTVPFRPFSYQGRADAEGQVHQEKTGNRGSGGANLRAEAVKAGFRVYPGVNKYPQLPRSWNLRNYARSSSRKVMENTGPRPSWRKSSRFSGCFRPSPRERAVGSRVSALCGRHRGRDPGALNWHGENFWQKPYAEQVTCCQNSRALDARSRADFDARRAWRSCWRATRQIPLAERADHHWNSL